MLNLISGFYVAGLCAVVSGSVALNQSPFDPLSSISRLWYATVVATAWLALVLTWRRKAVTQRVMGSSKGIRASIGISIVLFVLSSAVLAYLGWLGVPVDQPTPFDAIIYTALTASFASIVLPTMCETAIQLRK